MDPHPHASAQHGPDRHDRIRGCLLGGAVGDALGADIEFLSLSAIRDRYGPGGVDRYVHPPGRFTDDTQMSLFTAEAMIRAQNRFMERGLVSVAEVTRHAYLRWHVTQTQGRPPPQPSSERLAIDPVVSGWLIRQPELYARRAPGDACLRSLRAGGHGSVTNRINDQKGCGTVMRVAPIGFTTVSDVFTVAVDAAAITHTHPTAYLSAGALALIVAEVFSGRPLRASVGVALDRLADHADHGETTAALRNALALTDREPSPTAEAVESLGKGWIAEEALAIAVYCALVAPDFATGVRAAVNHSGDSDSTGAIAGNLLGVALGADAIPAPWLDDFDAAERRLVETVADDLWSHFHAGPPDGIDGGRDLDRYPPN